MTGVWPRPPLPASGSCRSYSLPQPPTLLREGCGHQLRGISTKSSHMQIKFLQVLRQSQWEVPVVRPLPAPKLYIRSLSRSIKGVWELLHHLRASVIRTVKLVKRTALPKSLKLCHTPHWLVDLLSAQPDPTQCRVAWSNQVTGKAWQRQRWSQLQQQKWWKQLPLPAHTCYTSLALLHHAQSLLIICTDIHIVEKDNRYHAFK